MLTALSAVKPPIHFAENEHATELSEPFGTSESIVKQRRIWPSGTQSDVSPVRYCSVAPRIRYAFHVYSLRKIWRTRSVIQEWRGQRAVARSWVKSSGILTMTRRRDDDDGNGRGEARTRDNLVLLSRHTDAHSSASVTTRPVFSDEQYRESAHKSTMHSRPSFFIVDSLRRDTKMLGRCTPQRRLTLIGRYSRDAHSLNERPRDASHDRINPRATESGSGLTRDGCCSRCVASLRALPTRPPIAPSTTPQAPALPRSRSRATYAATRVIECVLSLSFLSRSPSLSLSLLNVYSTSCLSRVLP